MMGRRGYFLAFAIAAINALCVGASSAENTYGSAPDNIKDSLDRLVRSYPDQIAGHDNEFLILNNGVKFRLSDGRTNKTFREMLENPDIDDMFYSTYPTGTEPKQPAINADPGRVRFEPLFVAMYGDCNKGDVVRNLRTIDWMPKHHGGKVTITTRNGVASALEKVSREQIPRAISRDLQLPDNCRFTREIDACLRGRDRHQHQICGLLALGFRRSHSAPVAKPRPDSDRENFRETRFYLGRLLVPLRHHAF
jgi:hypothetical protein